MDAFQEEMTAEQWAEWCAFFQCEPTGNVHLDWLWGTLLALTQNVHRAKGPPVTPADLLPYLAQDSGPRVLTDEDIEERNTRWRAAAIASGGRVIEAGQG